MDQIRTTFIAVFVLCLASIISAGTITGTVVDAEGNPLAGANVYLVGTILGDASRSDGSFTLKNVPEHSFELRVEIIGYTTYTLGVNLSAEETLDVGTISLSESEISSDPVLVTAGKFEQRRQDVAASITSLDGSSLKYRNTIRLDDALKYVSGVNLNGGQISIRGSTGYSRGAGSRVLFLVDGVPLLTGDTQDIVYESVPTYLVKRVEILKGAGSALYGSSAVGGVINVITKDISTTPSFYVQSYGGVYDSPTHPQWEWSESPRYTRGAKMTFSNQVGKLGFLLGGSRDFDDSYRQNDWRKRWNGSAKIQLDLTHAQRLIVTGNYMTQRRGSFLYWKSLEEALVPDTGQEDDIVESDRYYVTSRYFWVFRERSFLTVRGVYYKNQFEDNISTGGGNLAESDNLLGEIQLTSALPFAILTAGIESSRNTVNSNIFGDRDGVAVSSYLELTRSFTDGWELSIGSRLDRIRVGELTTESQFSPKFGIVFKPTYGTAIRTAVGAGFRGPSMGEAFTSTTIAGLGIPVIPNDSLNAEKSVYLESGINVLLNSNTAFDAAVFYNRFSDLIEPDFVVDGSLISIQFQNFPLARLWGMEGTLSGTMLNERFGYRLGYSLIDARHSESFVRGSLVLPQEVEEGQFLDFRPRHIFYTDTRLAWKKLHLGLDYRYISRYEEINELLGLFVEDADARVAVHTLDLRVSGTHKLSGNPLRLSFHINNLLNYNYVDLVGSLAPMRNYVLSLEFGE